MSGDELFARRLAERFASPPPGAAGGEPCPDSDAIWRASRGELPWSETERLLDHVASCAACATAWRMARELSRGEIASASSAPESTRRSSRHWVRYAAAAAIVVVLGGLALKEWTRGRGQASFRATAPVAIHALVPDGSTLPRSEFVLKWTPGPAGTRYVVQVSDDHLAMLAEARGLTEPSFRVPETALASLADGSRVLWLVHATLPDGSPVTTGTFLARVGPKAP